MMNTEKIATTVYQNTIPYFVEAELERLYENVFSTLSFLKIYNKSDGAVSTYIAEKNGSLIAVLLFQYSNDTVKVLNEVISLSAAEIERFARDMFVRFPSASVISFNAIQTEFRQFPFPCQRFNCSEDIVVTLPGTADEYLASLGKATRKNIKRYTGKLARSFPALQHTVCIGAEVNEQHVRDILQLNRARMARKQKVSAYDQLETEQVVKLVKLCGFVSILTMNGRVLAGEICSRVGNNYFSHVGAHDPDYDDYWLGTLNCYLTISECIRRGGKEFHFLWGQYAYKYSLLGVQRDLERLTIYRSRAHLCLNSRRALRFAIDAAIRRIKCVVDEKINRSDRSGYASQLLFNLVNHVRAIKRLAKIRWHGRSIALLISPMVEKVEGYSAMVYLV